jgi:hypothetical protein
MILKVLNFLFVFFSGRFCFERPKIAALAGLLVFLSGIDAIFARCQFADHANEEFNRSATLAVQ